MKKEKLTYDLLTRFLNITNMSGKKREDVYREIMDKEVFSFYVADSIGDYLENKEDLISINCLDMNKVPSKKEYLTNRINFLQILSAEVLYSECKEEYGDKNSNNIKLYELNVADAISNNKFNALILDKPAVTHDFRHIESKNLSGIIEGMFTTDNVGFTAVYYGDKDLIINISRNKGGKRPVEPSFEAPFIPYTPDLKNDPKLPGVISDL